MQAMNTSKHKKALSVRRSARTSLRATRERRYTLKMFGVYS